MALTNRATCPPCTHECQEGRACRIDTHRVLFLREAGAAGTDYESEEAITEAAYLKGCRLIAGGAWVFLMLFGLLFYLAYRASN
jgi:hypothetical protein